MNDDASSAPEVAASSIVVMHRLARRADGDEVIVGRLDTGTFIALPEVGAQAVDLLSQGISVEEVEQRLAAESAEAVDVADFVESLISVGFVARIDGHAITGPPTLPVTLSWLRPEHVGWLLTKRFHITAALIIVCASVIYAVDDGMALHYRGLLWSENESLVLLTQFCISWSLILVHELAHLAMARAAGVPGHVRLSTRLHFLVAQTDVSGIWSAPRRSRLAVYLAGMVSDALVFSFCVVVSTVLDDGIVRRLSIAVATTVVVHLSLQLLVFMRTDVYFVCQEITRCRNLYADAAAYLKYRVICVTRSFAKARPPQDPTLRLPLAERRVVRGYVPLLVVGTVGCLGVAATVTLPFELFLLLQGIGDVTSGDLGRTLNGTIVLGVVGSAQYLWIRAWWGRHGHRLLRKAPAYQ